MGGGEEEERRGENERNKGIVECSRRADGVGQACRKPVQ